MTQMHLENCTSIEWVIQHQSINGASSIWNDPPVAHLSEDGEEAGWANVSYVTVDAITLKRGAS